MAKTINIGGASGYWGESAMATPQLLTYDGLDYLVYDYLAEITMSIMARAKAKDPEKGYATDFVDFVMRPCLEAIAAKGVKVISNAGGVNPKACGEAVRALIAQKGLDLKVAIVTGDDLIDQAESIAARAPLDMFSKAPLPPVDTLMSINAYLGAFPIAKALSLGADIVITGRCVDSAVTLGACIHEFGWTPDDLDLLASGSLAGHILECGPQATGGNFTDWEAAGDIVNIGYPIAQISADGSFITTKPKDTGGIVNVGTVSEQMLYEIGDPKTYILPDVICDFTRVTLTQIAPNCVKVSPASGRAAPQSYKTCLTYKDGFRGGTYVTFYGEGATAKADKFAKAALARAQQNLRRFNLGDYTEFSQEILGSGSQFGQARVSDEVVMKLAVKHSDARGVGIFLKDLAGLGLATPPGLSGFTGGGRARPSPVIRLFSYLTDKADIDIQIDINGDIHKFANLDSATIRAAQTQTAAPKLAPSLTELDLTNTEQVPLIKLAWGRSGDKGDKANIGIIARNPDYLPYIWNALSIEKLGSVFSHFTENPQAMERFYLPGSHAMNILIDTVLGGGGAASLRNDAQAKGYAQILLRQPIAIPKNIAGHL